MIQQLREMRAAGEPLLICAERIGVSYAVASDKARELKIAGRRSQGRNSGRAVAEANRNP